MAEPLDYLGAINALEAEGRISPRSTPQRAAPVARETAGLDLAGAVDAYIEGAPPPIRRTPERMALGGTMGARPGPTSIRAALAGSTRIGPTRENAQALAILRNADRFLQDGATPETIAQVRRIARETGDSLPLAAQTYAERAMRANAERGAALLQANPALAALANRRGYADLSRELERLAVVEQAANSVTGRFILSPASEEVVAGSNAPRTDLDAVGGLRAAFERGLLALSAAPAYSRVLRTMTDLSQIGMTADEIYAGMLAAAPVAEEFIPDYELARMRQNAQMAADRLAQYTPEDVPFLLRQAAEDLASVQALRSLGEQVGRSDTALAFSQSLPETDGLGDAALAFFIAAEEDPTGAAQFLGETLLESGPTLIASFLVGAATRSPALASLTAGATSLSLEEVNTAMSYIAEQGYPVNTVEDAMAVLQNSELMAEAARRGLARGVIIGTLDALSGGIAGAALSRNPVVDAALQGAAQGTLAGTGEALGALAATGEIDWTAVFLEGLIDVIGTPVEVAGVGLRSFGGRASLGAEELLPQELVDLLNPNALPTAQERAEAAAAALETARAAVEETQTFARDPEAVRELLVEAGDAEVGIPAAEIERLYQEGTLTDEALEYLQITDELTAQGELSGDVVVPASRVLTLPGDGFAALVDHVRTTPGAPTVAEARDAVANREADIERLQGVLEQAEATVGEVNTLADTIFEQLRSTQTLSRGQSRAAARLLAERYAARAALFDGVTASQLYERDLVTFAGPGAPLGAPTMEQAAQAMQRTPEFQQWFGNSAVVDESGAPLVVYHGTAARRGIDQEWAFDLSRVGEANDPGFYGSGVYTSPIMEEAMDYAAATVPGGADTVAALYVSIQNPFIWDARTESSREATAAALAALGVQRAPDDITGSDTDNLANREERRRFNAAVRAAGYDGVLVYSKYGESDLPTEVVAFDPSQLKAIANERPTSDPRIMYQDARPTSDAGEVTGVPMATRLSAAFRMAQERQYRTGRELKVDLQEASRAAQAEAGIDLTTLAEENIDRLADFVVEDALEALQDNANAIGWYDRTITAALQEIAQLHPEILTDQARRLQFTWALAVTSNGLKVDKNFEVALQAYEALLASDNQRFPAKVGIGTAAGQIDLGLAMYGRMLDRFNGDHAALAEFMNAQVPVRDLEREYGVSISGEGKGELVRGASILGPKIGNGFFANLYGNFDALTMDRWLMRTVGRWRGTLISINEEMIAQKRGEIRSLSKGLSPDERRALSKRLPVGVSLKEQMTRAEIDALAVATAKESAIPKWRAEINQMPGGEALRKLGNALAKYLDGQVEAPAGARERAFLREVFRRGLDRLQQSPEVRQISNQELTMSDLQALLWYPEKRLYDTAKRTEGESRGYEDDEAPDYANAARAVVRARLGQAGRVGRAGGRPADDGRGVGTAARGGADVTLEQPAVGDVGGTGSYSGGGLAPLEGAPNVVGAAGPDPNLVAVAEQYAARNGIDLRRQSEFVEVDPERAARIAQAYEEMEHAPQDPAVQEAYQNLIAQTIEQYQALVDAGYSFTFFDSATDPYDGNPWNAMRDLRANKTMAVYGTYDGYGTEGLTQGAVDDNPMLQDTGLVWRDQNGVERPVTANDLFRAVHDAFGHGIEGAGFRARGEENAWQAHVRLFTGSAIAAITSETRGQNSWLNYGPYGEQNRTAGVEDTVFADQKTGLMPEWTWTEGRAGDAPLQEQIDEQPTTLLEQGVEPTPAQLSAAGRGRGAEAGPGERGAAAARGDAQQRVNPADLSLLETPEGAQEFFARPGWGMVTATTALPDTEFYRNQRERSPALFALSEQRQADRNAQENERLQQQLEAQGIPYVVLEGMYKGEPDGISFLIFADESVVSELGRAYQQESVLTSNGLIFTQRPQPNVRPTGEVQVGAEARAQEFFSVLPSGQTVTMGLDFARSGPGVAQIPAGYTVDPTRPQLPVRPDGLVELYHWSSAERETVDPAFAGTSGMRGEELERGARLSFYGVNPRETVRTQGTGYVKESGLGAVLHVAFVDPQRLYPWFEDPDGLVAGKNQSDGEAAIRAAGYLGHYTTDDGSGRAPLGNVAAIYEALPVQVVPQPIATPALEQPTPGPQTPSKGAVGAPRGAYRLPTNDDPRNIIELTANSDASTFVHEVGHMFLFQMLRDLQDTRLTAEGRARLEADIAATRSWFASNAEQGLTDLQKLARDVRKRANADAGNAQLQLRASRLEAAVQRAEQNGGAAYMQRVAEAFLDPDAQGYDEAAEVVFHELWARGFEQYLGSGSAPSESLRSVFSRFAKYITSIYQSLRRLNVNVSPEVADVFDRLLATEEAIRQERRGATYQLSPGVLDGATPAEARELRRLAAEAEEEATTQMARREENALKQQERDRREARRKALTTQITEQVSSEPAYVAMSIAATGRLPDGTETGTGKISRAEVEFVADAATADRIPRRAISGRTTPDNAIPLADLALLSGFPDIDSLVTALSDPDMRSLQDEVAARVEDQMQAEFGAEADPDALRNQAIEAAQNTKFQQLQQLQLRILRRLAAEPLARVSRRQAEQVGAPPAAADTAAERAAEAEQAAARTPREGVQSALARIRANVQRQANIPQRRAQAAATRQTRGIQRNIDPTAIAEAARRYVAALEVGKATPARYRQAAQRLTVKIERAIAARNYTEASSLMEQRALNLAVAQEAAQVQTKVEAQRKRWRQVLARPDKRLAANYDMNWVNAIRVMLEPIGFARVNDRNFKAEDALAVLQEVEPALYEDILAQIDAVGRDAQLAAQADPKQPHRALSVTRMMEIFDLANQLLANARNTHGLLVDGRRIEFGKIAAEVGSYVDQRRRVRRREADPSDRLRSARTEAWLNGISGFVSGMARIADLGRNFDNGDPRGPFTRYLVRPVLAAVDAYTEARLKPLDRLGKLLVGQKDLIKLSPIKADELAPGFRFRNRGELLMAVLNSGNESNLRKLLMGGSKVRNQWSAWTSTQTSAEELDTSRWDAFLDRMFSEGVLTKEDMDAVQGIWDIFEDTKSGAQAAHQKMFGYRFVEIEASPVQTPFGTYRGGYVPAVLDRLVNPNADKFDAQEAMSQQSNASMFPGAEKGFTQARTDATYVIDLDITRLPSHFDRVMRFTHLGPAVQQAARLVNHPEFRAQVDRVSPTLVTDALIPWLQRTVQQQATVPETQRSLRFLEPLAKRLEQRVGILIMGGNLKNAAEQLTGLFPALLRVRAKHLLSASATWRIDGAGARRHMMEASPFMRRRLEIGANEILNQIDTVMREPGLFRRVEDFGIRYSYILQQLVSNTMEPTIWLAAEREAMETIYPAAYADALSQTGDDATADRLAKAEVYAYADGIVRSTQGSTRPSDISNIEAAPALRKLMLKFYSFFNAMMNLASTEISIAINSDLGWAARNGRAFYVYLMALAIPGILSKMLGVALSGGLDDLDELDDEDARQLAFEILLGSQIETAMASVPYLGQFGQVAYGQFTDAPFDDGIRASVGTAVAGAEIAGVVGLIRDIASDETDVSAIDGAERSLNAVGLVLGLPTNWLAKPLAYAERVEAGEADPEGLVDIVQGILTGRDGTER